MNIFLLYIHSILNELLAFYEVTSSEDEYFSNFLTSKLF
jgi:hypothetical protein